MQKKQKNKGSIPLIRGVHLHTDAEITVHKKSNECRKSAQEGRNMARYPPCAFFLRCPFYLGINRIENFLKKKALQIPSWHLQ